MLDKLILPKVKLWLDSPECKVRSVIEYIEKQGYLREPQRKAIEVYLYLKLAGENKPLWQLFTEGFFLTDEDLSKLYLSQDAREILENNKSARAFFEFIRLQAKNSSPYLSDNETLIAENAAKIDFTEVAKKIFYGVNYPDYLFSLPMGAGKTFLMASMMYLDLYFAQTEPDNKLFAHNFLVLIPSGLKSSIIPSLKTIEKFEPGCIIPEPTASNLKKLVNFEVLDEQKSAKKSNKARNPNVQKIARYQPFDRLTGLIMIVNAEKVILERLELDAQGHLFEKEDKKNNTPNELRSFIGKIPNLQIYIDEVHHVPSKIKDSTSGISADDEIKLRQVVNGWTAKGTINSVLGFSGTPFLDRKEKISFGENISFESENITNTVYYFPLLEGIKTFLKKPEIKSEEKNLTSLQIIRKGVEEFIAKYSNKIYDNGTNAKLAIYCGTIERLETEIYPFLTDELKIDKDKILRYHRGNPKFKAPENAEAEFRLLDTPYSRKEIVLLVQIGKEGWDCRSLTGVILSQSKDCPANMVLQTSCRCLRQVEQHKVETALIWLSHDNAKLLEKQLEEKQKTSIGEINSAGKTEENKIKRFSRLEYLKLPEVDFYQLRVEYDTIVINGKCDPHKEITALQTDKYLGKGIITERKLANYNDVTPDVTRIVLETEKGERADFNQWLFRISKESFGLISLRNLRQFEVQLKTIFENITFTENGARFFNDFYDLAEIRKQIRLAFHVKRRLQIKSEIIPDSAKMLIVAKLDPMDKPKYFYPNEQETKEIIEIDASGLSIEEKQRQQKENFEKAVNTLREQGLENFTPAMPNDFSPAVKCKDKSFHFLPYKLDSSFELEFLKKAFEDKFLKDCNLEVYFNGERDITDFRISCYTDKKKYVGKYTPDFLIIQRKAGKIHRVLIVETKGAGFAEQRQFNLRRKYVESEFLRMNNKKFKYKRFDYIYLEGEMNPDNIVKLNSKIKAFFCD